MDFWQRLSMYYGADWAGMILVLLSIYFVGQKKRCGFVFGVFGCLAWLAFGFMTGSVASVLANSAYAALNVRGYLRWKATAC